MGLVFTLLQTILSSLDSSLFLFYVLILFYSICYFLFYSPTWFPSWLSISSNPSEPSLLDPPPCLWICTKCTRKSKPTLSSSLPTPLPNESASSLSSTPTLISTGQQLYDSVCQHPVFSQLQKEKKLTILPVRCLSNCNESNCVSFQHPTKYSYQFGQLNESQLEDIEDLATFSCFYSNPKDPTFGFSKNKTRPSRLRQCVARIPPFVSASDVNELNGPISLNPVSSQQTSENQSSIRLEGIALPGTYV